MALRESITTSLAPKLATARIHVARLP